MAAAAGASGARAWLQAHHMTWLTPRRLKAGTVALFVAATLASSVGLSGSTKAPTGGKSSAGVPAQMR
jgi:hypothetical protein